MANDDDNYNPPENDAYGSMDEGGRSDGPSVAAPKGKNFVIIGLGILIIGLLLYLFLGGKGSSKKDEVDEEEPVLTTSSRNAPAAIGRPVFNDDIVAPPPPPPVVPDEVVKPAEEETAEVSISPLQDPKKRKRYQSSMLVTSGVFNSSNLSSGATSKANQKDIYSAANDNDPNVGFADNYYNQDSVPNAYARKLGNTARLITQGKILEAVLETPINTDVPGMIRGIISHDVYGESARTILIPKGSRVVGTYNNQVVRGNKRVNIIWTRVIRPDGIDIMIRSPGTDQLGTAGIEGIVDNKYLEVFSSAFLVSAINIAVGIGTDSISNSDSTTTSNTDGSSTTTSSSPGKDAAVLQAVDLFGSAGSNLIDGALNTNPTITIEQGTRVSIFVNRDLVFPSELINQVQIIQ